MNIIITAVRPTRFSVHDCTVTHDGQEHAFWAELDLLNDDFVTDFNDDEPRGDFDFEAWRSAVEHSLRTSVAGIDS